MSIIPEPRKTSEASEAWSQLCWNPLQNDCPPGHVTCSHTTGPLSKAWHSTFWSQVHPFAFVCKAVSQEILIILCTLSSLKQSHSFLCYPTHSGCTTVVSSFLKWLVLFLIQTKYLNQHRPPLQWNNSFHVPTKSSYSLLLFWLSEQWRSELMLVCRGKRLLETEPLVYVMHLLLTHHHGTWQSHHHSQQTLLFSHSLICMGIFFVSKFH